MCWHAVFLMCISRVVIVNTAPLLLYQSSLENSLVQMQQQIQELQMLQQISMIARVQQQQPIFMILPTNSAEDHIKLPDMFKSIKHQPSNKIENTLLHRNDNHNIDNDDDSEVIEASSPEETIPPRVLVMLPQGRFSIGSIIQAIPWLPYEINVPDTIIWAWNGISSIISGIGQRVPFRRPLFRISQDEMMNLVTKQSDLGDSMVPMPIVIVPVPVPMNLNTNMPGFFNNLVPHNT